MISLSSLYYKIGNFELKIPELIFAKGKIYKIKGGNGSGKTTLLRLICGLYRQNSGRIEIFGASNQDENWLYRAGIYLDESFLIDYLTPLEFLNFKGLFYKIKPVVIDKFSNEINESISYKLFSNEKLIRELSQGNKKKVGIYSSFMHDPEILIFDEPFEGLDEKGRFLLIKLLSEKICDRIGIITVHHEVDLKGSIKEGEIVELEMKNGSLSYS
ncbi:MAG: ATP-binding cassette domain-containing protein [Candidatus Marinimicrobia bacterium]|nr:ATP-binding cassette domain-containing protein [Candidatus Neomarinimicrobiota bacterium]